MTWDATLIVRLESCSLLENRGAWPQVSSERGMLSGPSLETQLSQGLKLWFPAFSPRADYISALLLSCSQDTRGKEVMGPGVCAAEAMFLPSGFRWKDFRFALLAPFAPRPTHQSTVRPLLFSPSSVLHCLSTFYPGPVPVQCGSPVKSVK